MAKKPTNTKGKKRTAKPRPGSSYQAKKNLPNDQSDKTINPVRHDKSSAGPKINCNDCLSKHDGSCKSACKKVQLLLPLDRSGAGRAEYTNQYDIDVGRKTMDIPLTPDYSDLLKVTHLYTAKELAVLKLVQQGKGRPEICRVLAVSNPRISQLIRRAKHRYEDYVARTRVLVGEELRKRNIPQAEEPLA